MSEFTEKSVVEALARMFNGKWFDITVVHECAEVFGATDQTGMDALGLWHVQDWESITNDTKNEIVDAALEVVSDAAGYNEEDRAKFVERVGKKVAWYEPQQPVD